MRVRSRASSNSSVAAGQRTKGTIVDAREIFELVIKADEKLKYATEANRPKREQQARELLERALSEARAIENGALIAQTQQRLADLDAAGSATDV
jgi:hypothetical protein